jgi:hypothetical protein
MAAAGEEGVMNLSPAPFFLVFFQRKIYEDLDFSQDQ